MHAHIFDRFLITPRCHLRSPVPNCGKTTLLDIFAYLVPHPKKCVNISVATLYRILDLRPKRTVLLDEGENLGTKTNDVLRSVLDGGYRAGATIDRTDKGYPIEYDIHGAVASAAANHEMYEQYLSRSIILNMQRASAEETKQLRKLTTITQEEINDFNAGYQFIVYFFTQGAGAKLNPDPEIPAFGRLADNWRPLISIADACSPEWGKRAREALLAFVGEGVDEDKRVKLLRHVRVVFSTMEEIVDARGQIPSKVLLPVLRSLPEADGMWARLTERELAALLKDFRTHDGRQLGPTQLWPPGPRTAATKSFRGYVRADFERAWRSYLDEGEAPPAAGPQLRLVAGDSVED